MGNEFDENLDNLKTDEILLLLQEKRTLLSVIRIGISTIIAQISILGFLIATSRYYAWMEVLHLIIPFTVLNVLVFCVAAYFIIRPLIQLHLLDRDILRHKKSRML